MTDPKDPPHRRLYRARDESVWTLIRQRYLSGETQKTLALAYDVPICTIQKRISREGWSKRAAIGIRPTFGGMAAPRAFEIVTPAERWPEAYAATPSAPAPAVRAEHEADPPSPAPSAGEAADRATAAAGRAVAAGRYEEAERLGRLAVTLQKLAGGKGGGGAKVGDRFQSVEDEEDEDQTPEGDRPLNCTMNTCAVQEIYRRARETVGAVFDRTNAPLGEDLLAWTAMGEALGAAIDPEVAEIAAALRAEGMAGLHGKIGALLGPMPSRPRLPDVEIFRKR